MGALPLLCTKRAIACWGTAFAYDEGEGDRSLAYWRSEHERFFRKYDVFSEDMLLVCERFRLIEILAREEELR